MERKSTTMFTISLFAVLGAGILMTPDTDWLDSAVDNAHPVSLDGIDADEKNILDGTYPLNRNLVLVTDGEPTGNIKCFLDWITSPEGQEIVGTEFVKLDEDRMTGYSEPDRNGTTDISCGGSTSINETMTRLAEAYMAKYDYISITMTGGGSGTGEKQTASGVLDIGMLSRDMSDSYQGVLVPRTIGMDGVAVIVNVPGVDSLTMEQVASIFSGEIDNWNQVGGPDRKIGVIIREEGSGTRDCFDGAMSSVSDGWDVTRNCITQQSTGNVIRMLQTIEGTIGYVSIGQLSFL